MKKMFIIALTVFALALTGLQFSSSVYAAPTACPGAGDNSSKDQVLKGISRTGEKCNAGGVTNTIAAAVEILSLIAGIVAVIMIIFAGFKYITSGGDATKVATAKTSLIYALVGLAVAALAQILVRFVLFQTSTV